jgi:hypothetical protein
MADVPFIVYVSEAKISPSCDKADTIDDRDRTK